MKFRIIEETMSRQKAKKGFAVCINNADYPASLERSKIYEILPDEKAAQNQLLRVKDESGEDYLYPAECFITVQLPEEVIAAITSR